MDEADLLYYDVLLPTPAGDFFTYSSPANLNIGERVVVPFGRREMTGIVAKNCPKPSFPCKEILMRYDEKPLFSEKWIMFIKKLASYYAVPVGLALHGLISEKLLNLEACENHLHEELNQPVAITLSENQRQIVEKIPITGFSRHLLQGVTGSGKTEIYLEIAKKIIDNGGQVLYIVPEISLTPQLTERIAKRFGQPPVTFHSKLATKKRESAFLSFASGETKFLIGARSALFIPVKNLQLIIIDEEHEQSFKQEDAPPYHLRDMAVVYAEILDIPVIMGTATPSIESAYNAKIGKYTLHKLEERHQNAKLPEIEILDIKNCDMIENIIAEPLYDKIWETVKKGEQVILFLNRKGYSTSLYCKKCGEPAMCVNCSVGLVYFKYKNACSCRYCGTDYVSLKCESCGNEEFNEWGAGTEKVAEFMETMFPGKVLRIDMENSSSITQLSKNLTKFENNEASILVGTQLVAKGLHFPSVTLVGVLGIDSLLSMPDFRGLERAYQILVQVSGRAGRENLPGKVYIQTMNPEAPIFNFIKNDLENDFYDYELERRKAVGFPPYGKLARLLFAHSDKDKCRVAAREIGKKLKENFNNMTVLGPADADIVKIKNKFRVSILLKSPNHSILSKALIFAQNKFENIKIGSMTMKTDKDPYFLM